jgi:F-type H+-transporting ATPase subunit delta
MRDSSIAGNYAEALLTLAQRAGDPAAWGRMIDAVGEAVRTEPRLRLFLESPRVTAPERAAVVSRAFQDRFPRLFVQFLQAVIRHRRQMLLPEIATAYGSLLDAAEGRVRADVTVARALTDTDRTRLAAELSRSVGRGKQVDPQIRVNPALVGGAIVRIGDTVIDGSVRNRLSRLRRQLAGSHVGR